MLKNKKKFCLLILLIFFKQPVHSIENKILFKIENEIITSQDIRNEYKYLLVLNNNIRNLEEKKKFEISKKSIIREKIKKIELSKNFKELKIEDKYLDKMFSNIYKKIGINNLNNFKKYLKDNKMSFENVKEKIKIETLWNELIYAKFYSKVKINKAELKEKFLKNKKETSKSYLLSEIFFKVLTVADLDLRYAEIKSAIDSEGFDNAALTYSIADTSNVGGKIGWVSENEINEKINEKIHDLKIGDYTGPILMPAGFVILKVNDTKETKNEIDVDKELNRLIKLSTNSQLNQFSSIYFNKIKKNIKINEL